MKKAFRDAYNRELALLYERSREFAAEYPGIADRLGGLLKDNLDPAVAGLLEGTAFMAARVQLKMDEEFRTFTAELLEQVFPDALAPTPSVMLVQATLPDDRKELEAGKRYAPGAYLDARFRDADQRVSCRFRLCAPLTLWPIEINALTYHGKVAGLGALGQDVATGTQAGLQIGLRRSDGIGKMSDLALDYLDVMLTANLGEAVALYEQLQCDTLRLSVRYLDAHGDPVFMRLDPQAIEQVGFGEDDRLFPHDMRLFDGFALLREAFVFPRKFLGFRITGLKRFLAAIHSDSFDLVFEFDAVNETLASRLTSEHLALHAVPAVNLFAETASQVRMDDKRHEYVVTPDSSPLTHYEIYRLTQVQAHFAGTKNKIQVHPLYGLPKSAGEARQALYYTTRRKQRRLTGQETRFGERYRYRGTETFIALYEPENDVADRVQRLQISALCTNRHLAEYLPIGQSKNDFHLTDDTAISLSCVAGPTRPRESVTEIETDAPHRTRAGDVYWRLISYLSLSHFGLDDRNGRGGAASLREMLSLFADLSDSVTETQLNGLTEVQTRPIVRSVKQADGYHTARGVEIRITLDESAFEGSGIILLGAVLDRFLAEYAAINSFTQTVIVSAQRGELTTFPPRTGSGPLI